MDEHKALLIKQHRNKRWEVLRHIRRLERELMILHKVKRGNLVHVRKEFGGFEDLVNRRNKYEKFLKLMISNRVRSAYKIETRHKFHNWLKQVHKTRRIPVSPNKV